MEYPKIDDIVFGPIYPERYKDVIRHLRLNFFSDEPLNKSLELCEPGQPHEELEEFSLNVLRQGLSFMGEYKSTGEVAGVILNGVSTGDNSETISKKIYRDHKLQKVFDFLETVDKNVDYLTHYNANSVLDIKILSVDINSRGKGIAGNLYKTMENFAHSKKFSLLRTDATSLFSQKLFEKKGFKTLKEIVYNEYPSSDAPLFKVAPPHVSFKLMVKKLQPN